MKTVARLLACLAVAAAASGCCLWPWYGCGYGGGGYGGGYGGGCGPCQSGACGYSPSYGYPAMGPQGYLGGGGVAAAPYIQPTYAAAINPTPAN